MRESVLAGVAARAGRASEGRRRPSISTPRESSAMCDLADQPSHPRPGPWPAAGDLVLIYELIRRIVHERPGTRCKAGSEMADESPVIAALLCRPHLPSRTARGAVTLFTLALTWGTDRGHSSQGRGVPCDEQTPARPGHGWRLERGETSQEEQWQGCKTWKLGSCRLDSSVGAESHGKWQGDGKGRIFSFELIDVIDHFRSLGNGRARFLFARPRSPRQGMRPGCESSPGCALRGRRPPRLGRPALLASDRSR